MEIREALEAAVVEHDVPDPAPAQDTAPAPAATPAPAVDAKEQSSEPSTPVKAEKPETAPSDAKEKPPAPVADDKTKPTVPETPEQRAQHRIDRPPTSWRKEAKGEWGAIPLQVRQEVYRREMEVERVMKETAPIRQEMESIKTAFSPYMARIQSMGATPLQAIDSLLKADHTLATAPRQQKAQYLAKLIADYDVDINDLDSAISQMLQGKQAPQQPQGFDPNYINQLVQQQLTQALAPFQQERQAREQAVVQQAAHTVESMSLDPKYPHFDDVREDMADLIELNARRGVALSMEDAYDRAVRSNPDTFGQITQQSALAQANQQHLQAQRAKTAASSVSGAPAGSGSSVYAGDGSLRSQIEAAFNNSRI